MNRPVATPALSLFTARLNTSTTPSCAMTRNIMNGPAQQFGQERFVGGSGCGDKAGDAQRERHPHVDFVDECAFNCGI